MALLLLICCAAGIPMVRRDPVYRSRTTSDLIGSLSGRDHGAELLIGEL